MQYLCILILFLSPAVYAANDVHAFSSAADAARFYAITKEIRCVVCQNQSIADSNAPLANDLREKVHKMILLKKTNTQIRQYLASRYGDFILLQPRFSIATLILWLFPVFSLVFITLILYRFFRQRSEYARMK